MTIEDLKRENCKLLIPTGWNIYEWAETHPDTTIAHGVKRIEKIFDFSDAITFGFSCGKDSTITANMALLELNLRKLRFKNHIDRDGNNRIDPLDAKWADKRLHGMYTDAEVCWTSSNDYAKRFLSKFGPVIEDDSPVKPNGLDLIEFQWICLPLAWQSGVSFDSGILISWDKDKKDMWVQPMHTKESLHGFEPLNEDNLRTANPLPLDALSPAAQKFHMEHKNVFECKKRDLFGVFAVTEGPEAEETVKAVGNYGRGPTLQSFRPGCHEKEEQDDYSYYISETSWLVDSKYYDAEACKKELESRYDLSKNVWFFKPVGPEGNERVSTTLISLRAEESLDRRVILSQGEYSTGQYSRNQGCNICSPVFDFTTADIWRLFAATDWDVNDVYQKLFEIGVGIGDQRVGSLLNYAAVRQISTVKALEPDLYARINARFQNVEFMAQFSRAGYFRIGKPRDTHWDGCNHIRAGKTPEEVAELSDRYEKALIELKIPYERTGNQFRTADPKLKGKPWFPLRDALKNMEG